ncbi:MAG: hypothetical protein JSU59_07580 [Nitrospirota bacterium]|nr:MAG: hypothetical protein JSU59_07580 [Nitrospirota bacterium]
MLTMLHYSTISRKALFSNHVKRVGSLALLVIVSGCAVFSGQPEVPLNDEVTEWVLESLRQREARIRSVKGLFRASVSGSSVLPISQNLDGVLFYERPYLIRLRGFARVGGTIFEFQRDGDYYKLNIPSSGKAVQGQITALDDSQDVSRIVEMSIRTMDAILGKFDDADGSKVLLYQDGENFRLDIQNMIEMEGKNNDPLMTRVWVNRDTFDVIQVEYLIEDEEAIMVVECSDFRAVKSKDPSISSPIRLPFHIRAEDLRSQGGSMTLTFQELAANAESAPI